MRYCFHLCLTLFFLPCISAQNPSWPYKNSLDSLLNAQQVKPEEPGFAVCILQNGQIIYEFQRGQANLELQKPIQAETVFNIGSVTKQFTAICILLLEEQGKLKRSDPVHQYLPELPDFGQKITLDHLISHTSGLHSHVDVLSLRTTFKNSQLDTEQVFSFYRQLPQLSFAPGTDFAYNNTAYFLLEMVIERVSGLKIADFMAQQIFKPLGMQHTRFCLIEADGIPDQTVSYEYIAAKKRYKKTNYSHNMLGATGVHCSLRDLALWQNNFDHNILGKGDPELIRRMETTYTLRNGTPIHYGTGLFIKNYRGINTVEHGGGWNNFLIQCRRFPEQKLSVLVASNNDRSSPFPMADAICDKILSYNPAPPKVASGLNLLPIPAQTLEGKYLSFNNRLRTIRRDADTLKIRIEESAKKREIALIFKPESSSDTLLVFADPVTGYLLEFAIQNRELSGFYWEGGDYFQCRRFFEKLDQTELPKSKWIGTYKAAGFKQKIHIRRKGSHGNLKLKPVFFMGYTMVPISPSVYQVKGDRIIVRFTKNGLILGNDWVNNLGFLKQ